MCANKIHTSKSARAPKSIRAYPAVKQAHRARFANMAKILQGMTVFLEDRGDATRALLDAGVAVGDVIPVSNTAGGALSAIVPLVVDSIGRVLAREGVAPRTVWLDYCGDFVGCYERIGTRVLLPRRWTSPLDDIGAFIHKFAHDAAYREIDCVYLMCTAYGRPRRKASDARIRAHKRAYGIRSPSNSPSVLMTPFVKRCAGLYGIEAHVDLGETYTSVGGSPMYTGAYMLLKASV